ncbi:acyltransferase family protein [Paratractidigestivibacter sp.]|uniref:acyltransferase family protein n=1 Tax=Paratractidigestivibacter sp. TaxID=2847316 RepID=UPI002ABD359C|nr:acyltransferase family protein [Paratractidigestivibacter sp.]
MAKDRYLQAVRGLAIAAVVLIHCLPVSNTAIAVRPLLNWAVATFLFLSGYLTDETKVAGGGYSLEG